MGIPEYEANRYEGRIKKGGILLSIHADDKGWKNKGTEILKRTGAEDIGDKGEAHADYDTSDRPGTSALQKGHGETLETTASKRVETRTGDPLASSTEGQIRGK
jgi:hypothetical protein